MTCTWRKFAIQRMMSSLYTRPHAVADPLQGVELRRYPHLGGAGDNRQGAAVGDARVLHPVHHQHRRLSRIHQPDGHRSRDIDAGAGVGRVARVAAVAGVAGVVGDE